MPKTKRVVWVAVCRETGQPRRAWIGDKNIAKAVFSLLIDDKKPYDIKEYLPAPTKQRRPVDR